MSDAAAISVITPVPGWHDLPSVRGPAGPSATKAGFAQAEDLFDEAWPRAVGTIKATRQQPELPQAHFSSSGLPVALAHQMFT